ncbi:MAG: ATP-binding protein [Nitrospirota bacterium]
MSRISLRYRIALTIFLLELVMIGLVLWQTQRAYTEASQRHFRAQEDIVLSILGDLGRFALITRDYGELQPYVDQVLRDPNVVSVIVADRRGTVVVSTDTALIGQPLKQLHNHENTYWRFRTFASAAGPLGLIAIEFSNKPLLQAYRESQRRGILIASLSMALIALVGVALGFMLTRRLGKLKEASKRVAEGDLDVAVDISGSDEIADLGASFAAMTTKVRTAIGEVKEREELITSILQSIDEGFVVIDRDYRIRLANKAYCDRAGIPLEEIIGKHCYLISRRNDAPCHLAGETCVVNQTFETGRPHSAVHTYCNTDGSPVSIETKSYPLFDAGGGVRSVIEIEIDITEKRKLEEQLRQSQKMEAVGTLAGGVAHDFNNILTAIIGYGSLMKANLSDGGENTSYLDQMLGSAERAAHLTQSLLAFSRKQVMDLSPVDLNNVVRRIDTLLHRIIGEDIEIKTATSDEPLMVLADSGQLEQVVVNLATNARDAMPDGGSLTIQTAAVEIGTGTSQHRLFGRSGRHAMLAVTDTGSGMDDRTQAKIFEPFFTTKEVGKGTGLGLAIVYGIVKQHNGSIHVYSEPGKGTTFRIYVPLIPSPAADEPAAPAPPPPGGTETVLVAEDDTVVREVIRIALEQAGYTVIEAGDGEEALEKFLEHRDEIRVLLSDVIMPKMNGKELYEAIRERAPGIKALFVSGYTSEVLTRKGVLEEGGCFISKPVTPEALLRKLREVLDQ